MSQRETLKVLEQARALIADEACWRQGVYAEDQRGYGVAATSTAACAWCATGAIIRASDSPDSCHQAYAWLDAQVPEKDDDDFPFWRVAHFNDQHTHAEVLFLFDRTIARLRQEAP